MTEVGPDDAAPARLALERLLPERLHRLHRSSGLPVVFGGAVGGPRGRRQLVISRTLGTRGTSLAGLRVDPGRGMGGAVLAEGAPRQVDDYAATATISHEYDRIVVEQERLRSVFAVPVLVHGAVLAVLYGAARVPSAVGDRAISSALAVARHLQRDVEDLVRPEPLPHEGTQDAALAELAALIAATGDEVLRQRLLHIQAGLAPAPPPDGRAAALTPRELDVLRLVAGGASNIEVAAALGLSYETVKAYLRSALRKLGVHNRSAAVDAARRAGLLTGG